jgi:hypothetical protein
MSNRLAHFNDKPPQRVRLKKSMKEIAKTFPDSIHFLNGLFDNNYSLEYLHTVFTDNEKDIDRVIDLLILEDARETQGNCEEKSIVEIAKATVARMFPDESPFNIESILNRNAFNVAASIDEILRTREPSASTDDDANLCMLSEIFEGVSISLLDSALKDAGGSLVFVLF